MRTNKVKFIFAALTFFFLSCATGIFADDESYYLRFRSGRILAAELMPGESGAALVKNVNPYEPPSKITADVAYAAIVVSLDPGRGISIYDYRLKDSIGQVFPCVAIKENNGEFDASKWLYENAPQKNRYTLLFRVQLPPRNKPFRYDLEFNLLKGSAPVSVPFVRLNEKPFTNPMLFPEQGILLAPEEQIKNFYAKLYKEETTPTAPDKDNEAK